MFKEDELVVETDKEIYTAEMLHLFSREYSVKGVWHNKIQMNTMTFGVAIN